MPGATQRLGVRISGVGFPVWGGYPPCRVLWPWVVSSSGKRLRRVLWLVVSIGDGLAMCGITESFSLAIVDDVAFPSN
jgi:hypothetical protein